jgi:nucleotide-binding universal stress UspA family protein
VAPLLQPNSAQNKEELTMAKRILVPLDQSHVAEIVVPLVAAVARGAGATVRLLLVAPVPQNRVSEDGRVVAYTDQEMARLEAEGLDYLRTVEMQFGSRGDVECVVRFGDPVDEILREADAFGADLIAVTTEGRSALGRVVLGSVAEQVVRKADAPVMLMRAGRNGH